MIIITAQGQDVFISYAGKSGKKKEHNTFDIGRNFANKIWNAARLILTLSGGSIERTNDVKPDLADRWIRSRYNSAIAQITEAMEAFRFNDVAHQIYDFIWHDFCDWYLEIIKPRVARGGNEKTFVLRNAAEILAGSMQLLHPIMPFITEEIWQLLTGLLGEKPAASIMVSKWPDVKMHIIDPDIEREMEMVQSLISAIRTIRNEMNVPLGEKAEVIVVPADEKAKRILDANTAYILDLAAVKHITFTGESARPPKSAAGISDKNEVFVLLEGLVDFDRERARLSKEIERRRNFIASIESKLANENFLSRAPKDIIEQERRKGNDTREEMKKLIANLEALGD
jgi:valyl-tRNA synthetase